MFSGLRRDNTGWSVTLYGLRKMTTPTRLEHMIHIPSLPGQQNFCAVHWLDIYIKRSNFRNKQDQLLLSYVTPHQAVMSARISQWIRDSLWEAGIDVSIFSAHSTRCATTSAALARGASLSEVLAWRIGGHHTSLSITIIIQTLRPIHVRIWLPHFSSLNMCF